ncbi:hypothetical protein [Nannocystis pusilla]|uniref:hypothetical protein n=1 Tax=Nannocystis pusilla TaxID=889268 RepID=UPI003DA364DE
MPSVGVVIVEDIDIGFDEFGAPVKAVPCGSSPVAQAVAPKTHKTRFTGRKARVTTIDGRAERRRGQRGGAA